jgi:hypothetical protein
MYPFGVGGIWLAVYISHSFWKSLIRKCFSTFDALQHPKRKSICEGIHKKRIQCARTVANVILFSCVKYLWDFEVSQESAIHINIIESQTWLLRGNVLQVGQSLELLSSDNIIGHFYNVAMISELLLKQLKLLQHYETELYRAST